jgi:hypothetical protein
MIGDVGSVRGLAVMIATEEIDSRKILRAAQARQDGKTL